MWFESLKLTKGILNDEFIKCPEYSIPEKFLKSCTGELIYSKKCKKVIFLLFSFRNKNPKIC
jgi:hypothetical protein